MNYKTTKWYVVGLIVTITGIIAGVMVFKPALSQAIDTLTNINQGTVIPEQLEEGEEVPLTDHPEGRLVNAIVADALAYSNSEGSTISNESAAPDMDQLFINPTEGLVPDEDAAMPVVDLDTELEAIDVERQVFVIPVADFRSNGVDPDGFIFSFSGGNISGKSDATTSTCLMAPAYLPNDAYITDFYATIVDNSPTKFIWLRLYRLDNYTGAVEEVAYAATSPEYVNPNLYQIADLNGIYHNEVLYPDYSFYVTGCISGESIKLYSVRIHYYP